LPPVQERPDLPASVKIEPLSEPEEGTLAIVHRRLNDYVHPNYGSHLLALFPERSAAGAVLLDAAIGVYECFLEISWAEQRVAAPCTTPEPLSMRPWSDEVRLFKETVSVLHAHRVDRHLVEANTASVRHVIHWLESDREDEESPNDEESPIRPNLRIL